MRRDRRIFQHGSDNRPVHFRRYIYPAAVLFPRSDCLYHLMVRDTARTKRGKEDSMIIVDTREPSEFAQSHVEGAINIPPMEFMRGVPTVLQDVEKDEEIILYCRSGQRANTCSMILRMAGYSNLVNGINEGRVRQLLAKR